MKQTQMLLDLLASKEITPAQAAAYIGHQFRYTGAQVFQPFRTDDTAQEKMRKSVVAMWPGAEALSRVLQQIYDGQLSVERILGHPYGGIYIKLDA